jgi:dTMP kinase
VIVDRYVFSSYAYFCARGLTDVPWLVAINSAAPAPDVTLYLDVDPSVARERILARDGRSDKREELDGVVMSRVRAVFKSQPWGRTPAYHCVDAQASVRAVADRVAKIVSDAHAYALT